MNIKRMRKKISTLMVCGVIATSGCIMANDLNIAFADTQIDTDSVSGTITITGFDSNLKSFQLYNYNSNPITYNGRTYKTGSLIAIIKVNNGEATISGLPCGVYRVKEYKTTSGWSTNKSYYTVKITDDIEQELIPDEPELNTTGTIRLKGDNDVPLTGMEFQLMNVGTSSIIYNNNIINVGDVVGVFTADSDIFDIENLPYGVYELVQTKSTTGYHIDESIYTINIINDSVVEVTMMVANHTHSWDENFVSVYPTCIENGELTYICGICNAERTEIIDKLGHNWHTENPSCQNDGYKECTRCDEYMIIPKTGHDWNEGVLNNTSSCDEHATRTYTCNYCGTEKVTALPNVLGHSYESFITKASPTQNGGITKICKKCEYVQTDTVIAKPDNIELEYTEETYTGKSLKPSVKVYDVEGNEINKSYYSVNYYNNIKVGTASVKVTFKGNYTGSMTEEFMIYPKGSSILTLTPLYHGFTVKWSMQSKEVTGYELEYATDEEFTDAGILQTTKYTTLAKTISGLKPDTTYYVRIRTYKGSSYSQWSSVKTVVTK